MKTTFAFLLTVPAAVVAQGISQASTCPWEEGNAPINCGGNGHDLCGDRTVLDVAPCSNSDNACVDLTTLTDMVNCKGCPDEITSDVEICGAGGCSCGAGS